MQRISWLRPICPNRILVKNKLCTFSNLGIVKLPDYIVRALSTINFSDDFIRRNVGIFLNHTHDFSKVATLPSTMDSKVLLLSTIVPTINVPRGRRPCFKFNATVKTDAVIHVVGANPTLIKRCITLAFEPFCRIAIGEPKPIDLRRYPNFHRA